MTPAQEELRAQIEAIGGVAAWADKNGFNRSVVSDAANGRIPITKRMLKTLGFEAVVEHRRVG